MQHSDNGTLTLQVAVYTDGRLTLDGVPVSIEDLRGSLREAATQGGVVWYYRESAQDEPPPIAMEVMKAVVDADVPIRLSTRPDYSNAVGP